MQILRLTLVASVLAAASCAPAVTLPPVPTYEPTSLARLDYKAVLVSGSSQFTVFDTAVDSVAAELQSRGVADRNIQRFSATPATVAKDGVRSASRNYVLDAVAHMEPKAGQGCFVFATSHGIARRGLLLATQSGNQVLQPDDLDAALARGCGNAPTVVVVSGCFTGSFAAPPMTRDNRIILTASRADRTSFGCDPGNTYTVYDRCLLDAMHAGGTWPVAYAVIQGCVATEERRMQVTPSEPQAWFGPAVTNLPLPVSAH